MKNTAEIEVNENLIENEVKSEIGGNSVENVPKIPLKKKKAEALKRMQAICDRFELGNKLVDYLKEGKIYYSYAYSMDEVTYEEEYVELIEKFEKENNAYVYHVIEALCPDNGTMLSLLYVSDIREDWPEEQLMDENYITTFTYWLCWLDSNDSNEMGDIWLAAPFGYLARTDLTDGHFYY